MNEPATVPLPASASEEAAVGHRLVWVLFLFSGASGLIYEVLWTRQLGLVLGNTVQSLSAVLTAFMGGLALGSWLGGRWCHRLRRPLLAYGVLELCIGVYCTALPWVIGDQGPLVPFYRSLYGETGGSGIIPARFALSLALLVVPTTLMGATLPVLSQYLVRSHRTLGRTAGALYAVNTLGAVVGAAATGFLLLPEIGKASTNAIAVTINLVLGILAIRYGAGHSGAAVAGPGPATASAESELTPISPLAQRAVTWAFCLTGFAAMTTQIGWTRAISLGTGGSTYAFSLIVSVFILGLGLGGAWGAQRSPRSPDPLASLALLLLTVGLLAAALSSFLGFGPLMFFFLIAWGHSSSWGLLLLIQAIGIGLLILAPTFCMGATMPFTMQVATRSGVGPGRTVGTLYAVNTTGSILGSFLGGLVLIPLLHIQYTLFAMALLYTLVGAGLFLLSASRSNRLAATRAAALAAPAVLLFFAPPWDPVQMSSGMFLLRNRERVRAVRELRLREAFADPLDTKLLYYREGTSATVAVRKSATWLSLSVGGKPDASSDVDMSTQISSALVPAMLHATGPRDVLVIGLGSGVSAGCALAPESVRRVDVVEMSPEVVEASAWFAPWNDLHYRTEPSPWLETTGLELIVNDGRNHLLLTSRTYDVITCEPSNPWLAGIGNLFTREAFTLSRARLNPGGIFCQWIHTYSLAKEDLASVIRTLCEVFPHVQAWDVNQGDLLLIGSLEEIRLPRARLRERLAQPRVHRALARVHLDTEAEFLAAFLFQEETLRAQVRSADAPLHTDDNLLLEFSAPRALYAPERFLRDVTASDPTVFLDSTGVPTDERATFQRDLDLAVCAREHARWAQCHLGPVDQHARVALALAPNQLWAIETRNARDEETARQLLLGAPGGRSAPDPAAAIEILQRTSARSSNAAGPDELLTQALGQNATKLLGEGKPAEALAEVARIDDPDAAPKVALLRARILYAQGKVPEALAELDVAEQSPVLHWATRELAAQIMHGAGRNPEAVGILQEALSDPAGSHDPGAAPLWNLLARVLFEEKQLDAALLALEAAGRLESASPERAEMEARIRSLQGEPEDCIRALRLRTVLAPENPGALGDFVAALQRWAGALSRTEPERAGETLRLARRLSRELCVVAPTAPVGWELLGRTFLALEKLCAPDATHLHAQAASACRKALELHHGDASKLSPDLAEALK